MQVNGGDTVFVQCMSMICVSVRNLEIVVTSWSRGSVIISLLQYLPRDAPYCKARYCDRMSSVRPSVCLSVCL